MVSVLSEKGSKIKQIYWYIEYDDDNINIIRFKCIYYSHCGVYKADYRYCDKLELCVFSC